MTMVTPLVPAVREAHAQHEALRDMMDRCEELADALDAGRGDLVRLRRAVALLRSAFNVHRTFEEQVLNAALSDRASRSVVVARAHHEIEDRRPLRAHDAKPTEALRDVLTTLRRHLDNEERCHLQEAAIRRSSGDRIRRRTGHSRRGSRDAGPLGRPRRVEHHRDGARS